ncbi:transmembrane signal receptor [Lithospermum erythrorhizon]|uniref:non-specific serine/threonine protein kinase n=1 Tax=Lithospermum erythrorhizon TaxID=34254 RepID=A0AAV3Q5N5_LITER
MSKTQTQSPPSLHIQILIILCFTFPFLGTCQNIGNSENVILLKLKELWSNPPGISHWLASSSSDHCTWAEINCTGGSVTKIEIIDKNITEAIPEVICDLKNLSYIDLRLNYIPGKFPTTFYNCSKLEYLDLSQNYFVGTIPDDIHRLSPRLQYLNVGANNFTGDIPAAIGRLSGLKSLHLFNNQFNGSFPPEIGNLANLEELVMNVNAFKPQEIPHNFTQLKKLRNLWIREANLVGEIPQDIGNMTALEFVDLSTNGLTGSVPNGFFQLKNLTHLFLFKNKLSGQIPRTVQALNLEVIDLTNNSLTGSIPDDFGKLSKLTGLALYFNQLSGPVPESIGRLPSLVNVALFNNNLTGELPTDFGRYSNLEGFQVSSNNFTGAIPEYLCANGVLKGVVVFNNNLTGELPQSLGRCNSLEVVRLYNNRLSGRIPDGLWTSKNLTTLMISDNLFTGTLPGELATNLSLLEISNNQFSGEIPVGASSWVNLRVFKATNNLLEGEIPQELTALPLLTQLFLDGNQLSGNFPAEIISWQNLNTLNASRNRLSGEIPAAIGLLSSLNYLDLSQNDFSGAIPFEIGRLILNSLNLSSNRLSGEIPGELENAVYESSFLNNSGLCSTNPSLGLNACNSIARKSSKRLSSQVIAAVSSIAAIAVLAILLYAFFALRIRKKAKCEPDSSWEITPFQRLKFTKSSILSGLTEQNIIGSGGSGQVYRVPVNHSGGYVAVKKIWNSKKIDERLEKEFLTEIRILGSVRHTNIVKLLCFLYSEHSKLLVYEYMENCSLDKWLHGNRRLTSGTGSIYQAFDWTKRLQVAIGTAQGLCYMHHDNLPAIIHRDVKSCNILLDSEFNAKIADFGLAKKLKDEEPNSMSAIAGSFGYMAPECANAIRATEKIDVYSFGVVLLELVTGKEAHSGDANSSLTEWAWKFIEGGKPMVDALDKEIKEELHFLEEMSTVFRLGIMCTSTFPSSRPTMKDALHILLQCGHQLQYKVKQNKKEYEGSPLLKDPFA